MKRVELIIDGAAAHAIDANEPDHEVGDLQAALRVAWKLLTPAARGRVLAACADTVQYGKDAEGEQFAELRRLNT